MDLWLSRGLNLLVQLLRVNAGVWIEQRVQVDRWRRGYVQL